MGYIHVYTGNGKGKTTAALGLAVRAACAGKKVYIGQFIKGSKYSELDIVKYIPNITIEQYGRGCFIGNNPTSEDIKMAKAGLEKAKNVIKSGSYDIVILDEINIAIHLGLITYKDVIDTIMQSPKDLELVLTGRYAPPQIIEVADLVTDMVEVKHYYKCGVQAREGIEF